MQYDKNNCNAGCYTLCLLLFGLLICMVFPVD